VTRYQKGLLALLCIATLFDGLDSFAFSQTLPHLRAEFGMTREQAGRYIALINIGQILSYLLIRAADRWGRRPIFLIATTGYAVASLASGLTSGPIGFGTMQLLARIFLMAELSVAAVLAAEELPVARRGFLVGAVQASSGLGGVLCAALVPLLSGSTWGWRAIYLLGALPVLFVAPGWRWLRESQLFLSHREKSRAAPATQEGLWWIWRSQYRARILHFALIWFLTFVCLSSTILFWKEFALTERGLSEARSGGIIAGASLLALPSSFLFGRLSDRLGRRRAALVLYSVMLLGVAGAFTMRSTLTLLASLILAIAGSAAVPGFLSTVTAESFPTHMRAAAFGWSANLLGRSAFIVAPLLVGRLAQGLGWGPAVLTTMMSPLIALLLLLRSITRETARQPLPEK